MKRYGSIYTLLFLAAMFAITTNTYGQADPRPTLEPSYDISLQIIIGSNEAGKSADLGRDLTNVSRQLRSAFPFSGYRLAGTFMGRISNNGNYEYKSVSNIFGQEAEPKTMVPTFLEWNVTNLRNGQTAKGETGFQAQFLKFGARVPVATSGVKEETGKMVSTVSYESIGLNLSRVGLTENLPTLIGTLNLPGADGTAFLVMTIRAADR